MQKMIRVSFICLLQISIFCNFLSTLGVSASTPTGDWFIGCFPDLALLTAAENVVIPGDTFSSDTNFTQKSAMECGVKCGIARVSNKYGAFSQTGACLCMDSQYVIPSAANNSLCVQKTCDMISGTGDCDGNTYHWLVNASKLISKVSIATSGILRGAVPQNITVQTVPEHVTPSLDYNFGDGTSIDLISAKTINHIYMNAGFYKLSVVASSNTPDSPSASDAKVMQVETQPNVVDIDILSVVETEVTYNFTCSMVEGNNMTIDAEVTIGTQTIAQSRILSLFIDDASIIAVGASPKELLRATVVYSSPNSGIYIMPKFKFPASGIVAGFEVFITKIGFLRFQAFRPICSVGKYCYASEVCKHDCTETVDMMNATILNTTVIPAISTPNWQLISEISLNSNATGLKYLKAKSPNFAVERGDVLGIKLDSNEGDIGHATVSTVSEYHASSPSEVFPGSVISSLTTKSGIKHLIRAHLSTTSSIGLAVKFTEPGLANVKIKATNPQFPQYISNKYVQVLERISGFRVTAPLLMNETAYEVKKKIQFISTCDKGSNLTYEWRILKDNVSLSYNSSDGKLDFTPSSVGIYTLFASVRNLLGQENTTIQFRVQERVADLIINGLVNGVLIVPSSHPVVISATVINGTNITLTAEYEGAKKNTTIYTLYGEQHTRQTTFQPLPRGVCKVSKGKVTAKNMIANAAITKELEVGVLCPIGNFTVTTDPYLDKSASPPKTTSGRDSPISVTVKITQGSFAIYHIDKGDGTSETKNHSTKLEPEEFTFTLNYPSTDEYTINITAENVISKNHYTFVVEVSDCPPELLEITGSPEPLNPTMVTRGLDYKVTGTVTPPPNCTASGAPTSYSIEFHSIDQNKVLESRNVTKEDLIYVVPRLSQRAGKYKILFIQHIETQKGPQKSIKTAYLTIKQTPLLAMIDSGSSRQLPLRKLLSKSDNTAYYYQFSLDGSLSYDPDDKSNRLEYEWRCRSRALIKPSNRSNIEYKCNHTDFRPYQQSQWQSKMTVNTSGFVINATYEFLLTVSFQNRTSNYTQTIFFVRGNPPTVEFECITNCDDKWNIQEKLILRGKCPGCIDIQDIRYKWQLVYDNGTQVFTNPGLDVSTTGFTKQNFVIQADQLKENNGYAVVLEANYFDAPTSVTKITMNRRTSILPHSGSCIMLPMAGFVAKTQFQIQCQGWECPDLPLKYEFTTKTQVGSQSVSVSSLSRKDYPLWYSGHEPRNPKSILPLGDPTDGYNLTMIVRIFNAYGSFKEIPAIVIKVENVETSAGENLTSIIDSSKPKTNDATALAQWTTSVTSIINTERPSIGPGTTEAPPTAEELQTRAETRTKIIKSLREANLQNISISLLKQCGEALDSVLSKPSEVNEEGQDESTDFLDYMAERFLKDKQPDSGAEQNQQGCLGILAPLSSLMGITMTASEGYMQTSSDLQQAGASLAQASVTGPTQQPTQKQLQSQTQRTKNSATKYFSIMDKVSQKLLITAVSGEVPMVAKTTAFSMSLQKRTLGQLATEVIGTGSDGSGFTLPDNIFNQIFMNGMKLDDNETEVSCQGASMKKILQTWDLDNAQNSASEIESLKLASRDYSSMNVSNLTSDITIKIKNRPEKLNTSRVKLTFPQEMSIRKERIKSFDSPLLAEFGSPDNSTTNFTILIQYGFPPTLENYDAKLVITSDGIEISKGSGNITANVSSSSNATLNGTSKENQPLVRNSHIRVIDSRTIIMWDFQNFTYGYLGNKDVYFNFFYSGVMPDPVYVPNPYTFDLLELTRSRNYTMRTFSCSCLYWNSAANKWTDDGCKVDPYSTTFNDTVCKCNHLTSFGGFYVKPNPIPPLSADMFLRGYVLFVAVTVALAFFILGLVLARRADKRDLEKVGVCPLPDNNPEHQYVYQITVWTGLRRGGGTKSNVYFILSGDKGDTEIRHLKDPERTTFQQNSSDLFIFNTESSLGDLSHIRIWHDNSGGGWYLRKVVVTDIQTDKTFQFLCNRWLAVDKDDGQIEMVAPVSGKEDLKDFNYVFMAKTRNDLGDSHLWFSLYARPPRSPFTRCQRLACCVSLLMTSMMASAMFYNTFPKPTPETANYAAGLQFTWQQVYVALVSAAITVPINIIIVTLFRSSKPVEFIDIKRKSRSRVGSKASLADNASMKSSDSSVTIGSPDTPMLTKKGEEELLFNKKTMDAERGKVEKKAEKKKETYLFPHWCIYVAWFVTFGTIVASAVVVIMYGMVFGNSKSLEWLTAIIIGFLQDIIVIQPIKIFIIAIAFAAVVKTVQDERSSIEEHGKKLAEDEEWLHAHADTTLGSAVDTTTLRPPDGVKLDAMRELRFKERKMYAIVREILLYSLFVLVTFSISYSLREETGFWQTYGLEKEFKLDLNTKTQFNKDRFTGVVSQKDFWTYSTQTLVDTLFPKPWYPLPKYPKATQDFPGKLLINDLNHKIVNGVRLRQVRVKPASCKKNKDVKNVIKIDCLAPYTMENEEKTNFISNWTNQVGKRPTITHENQPWLYQHWDELDGYPFMAELATYFGGGYTQEMFPRWDNKKNLDKLKNSRWLDRHTRAVIVEFALFNPHTNHFSMVTITFEFAATGGCIHYYSIYTFKLYRYTTGYQFFVVVCEVLFILLLLLYLYRECKEFYQLRMKYFTQFWNIVEATIYGLSFVAIGFYVYRQKLANDLLKRLPAKKPQTFINFQFAANIDQIFIYIVALIVFFVSIKFIKLLRFNRRMSILADTLKHAWKPLGMFSIVMGIVLTSTFAFATIVFGRQMYGYRNMLVTAATQISLLLGKFDFNEYENTNRVIGPIFFFLYIIMVNWILLNMFLSIINDSFEVVSADLQEQSNDYEIVDFITDQFKAWLGVGKTRKEEIAQNIRWQNSKVKFDAVRAFSANSKASKKSVRWCDDDVLSGLTRSSYWHENPALYETKDLETDEVNRTVDRFIECINMLYFDDSEVARKMTKKVKQEISDHEYFEQEKARKQ